ncbi:hypothetical protein PBRA_006906 [Plasmodiophora brassicae]|nr:hypothetical protein PBRA_006906 [Plasmodiophora brassicae]
MFTLYDDGVRVAGEEVPVPVHRRVELCVISYQTNMMGAEPRQFTIDLDRTLNERTRRPECHIVNKPPVWNHAIGGHCLDFGQYVKAASKKNFQMIRTHTPDSILLQFGKLSKGAYHIDFAAPFSVMTAFALAVSSLCHKRLVQ